MLIIAREATANPEPALAQDRSLRHSVERYILSEIRAGRFKPGDRLKEVQLAQALGVSLTPVREALFRLVHAGHVVHLPRRGFYLAKTDPARVAETYSLRAVLEGLAAAWAARNAQPDELKEMDRLIERGEAALAAGDPLEAVDTFTALHVLIMRSARHSMLSRAWEMLSPLDWQQLPDREPRTEPTYAPSWAASHRELVSAIRSGDPARAEQVGRQHVERTEARSLSRRASEAP